MKVYSKTIIRIPDGIEDEDLEVLKAFADIFYTAYENLPSDKMRIMTKVIMENLRNLSGIKDAMSFAKNKRTGEVALFVFDYKPDGIFRTVQKDEHGYYMEVDENDNN